MLFGVFLAFMLDRSKVSGVCHDCDLYLLFGFPFMPQNLLPQQLQGVNWTATDRNASQIFLTIFRQFAAFVLVFWNFKIDFWKFFLCNLAV